MIELRDVRKVFNEGRPNEFWALRGVSLALEDNRMTVLKGPSGSGKTTLLSLVGCLARPTAGPHLLEGRGLSRPAGALPDPGARSTFGFVFQQFNLMKGLSVLENVMLPAYPIGRPHAALACGSGPELLERFGLGATARRRVEWLSGGEAQRVAIARALINDPRGDRRRRADRQPRHAGCRASSWPSSASSSGRQDGAAHRSHDPLVFDSPVVDRVVQMRDGRVTEA